ncbi:alkaline phosphatase family protein [Halorussus pelagicus]|uniref:hypothetical protein n=1 Tax=Halorussus pelagicus TaxID=2505977 RepID=UPI000FFB07F1|nr:hypothetical protein [Halorussus pelagicus]
MQTLAEVLPYPPSLIIKKLNSLYFTRMDRREYNTQGTNVFAEDWDSLVVLDACRDDQFRAANTLSGDIETKISRGSNTSEFLKANCDGRDLSDTVYVTASPIYYYHRDDIDAEFHEVVNVWNEAGWHDDAKTVLPETTTRYALDAAQQYPNKRLLVHYIQPHYPFIESDTEFDKKHLHDDAENQKSFWHELNHGRLDISRRRLWDLFEENLERALPHVEELVGELDDRTVVTADHGNMFGERARPIPHSFYGHPPKLYTDSLVRVPWLVQQADERREIVSGESRANADADGIDDETVSDRLADLGYVEM